MHLRTSELITHLTVTLLLWVLPAAFSLADTDYAVPPVCKESADSSVKLVDCLQTQQEILQHIIDYESLMLQADVVHRQRMDVAPHPDRQPASSSADATRDSVMGAGRLV